jgi:hypothetical protein
VALGLYDYGDKDNISENNKLIEFFNKIFTLIYLLEAILKIFATGFLFHKSAYLRESWNMLDFFVVMSG